MVSAGLLTGLEAEELPTATGPNVGRGEFVDAKVDAATDKGPWTAAGILRKGDVDTFLFLTFVGLQDVDLSGAEYLVFDLAVPTGQECGMRLLSILRDARGVEYLYDTQVSLDCPGKTRAYLPVKAFARAGWATNPEGTIDLSKVREIRIGWGGHKGREGERILFGTSAPKVCKDKT
jgi:hypothetical protein